MRARLPLAAAIMLAATSLCSAAEPTKAAARPAFVADGEPAFRIEVGAGATDSELLAVSELSTYLARVTGLDGRPGMARFYDGGSPSPEGIDGRKERIIYVGWTDFARANGLDGAKMAAPEEWAVKTVGSNLILTGGRPRGTLYAVYDFLERDCGVWWLDRDTEVAPQNPGLALPNADRRGKPQSWFRNLDFNDGWAWEAPAGQEMHQWIFEARNRAPRRTTFWRGDTATWRGTEMYDANYKPSYGSVLWDRADNGEPFHSHCHSFYDYLPPKEFYAEHPEYYTFTRQNAPKELPNAANGKMCLTHPEVRRIVIERLLDLIRRDRAAARSFGTRPPRFYDLSAMDSPGTMECGCATCREFVKKNGEESDLLIDFVNTAAAAVEQKYPDVTITTLAYLFNMKPPRTVKPRGNVLGMWCNWWNPYSGRPVLDQALTHPDNAWRLESLRAWRGLGARLGVWEYMEFAGGGNIPATFAPYAIGNYQVYNETGVEWFYDAAIWNRDAVWDFENFEPLRRWITLRLMFDPACDVPQMLDVFFRGYYGPAAKPMRACYDLLVAQQSKPRGLYALCGGRVDYLTPEFYQAIQRLLDEAETAAAADPGALLRVQRERPRVDLSMLDLWDELERQLPDDEKLPFERAKVLERFAAQAKAVTEGFSWRDREGKAKAIEAAVASRRDAKLPEPLAALPARERVDVTARQFTPWHLVFPWTNISVDDPDSATGRVMVFGLGTERGKEDAGVAEKEPGWTKNPLEFQLAGLKHTLTPEEFPRDGKYHLYKLGRTRLLDDANVKVLMNDRVAGGLDLAVIVSRRDSAAEWDVYVSAKLAGPSFAQSADKDCVRVERVLLVRAVPGFNRPEDERKLLAEGASGVLAAAQAGSKACDLPVTWRFRQDPKDEGMAAKWFEATPDAAWRDIRTEGSWTTQDAGKDYHGTAWYSVEFTVPADAAKAATRTVVRQEGWQDTELARFYLLFGAVDGCCRVWLDGREIGAQLRPPEEMWDKPFAIDLGTDAVKPGATHRLVVMVNKQSAAAGIWKPVEVRMK